MSTHQPTWRKHGDRQPHTCDPVFFFEGKMMHMAAIFNRGWENSNSDNFAFTQIENDPGDGLREWDRGRTGGGAKMKHSHINSPGFIKKIYLEISSNLVNHDFKIVLVRDEFEDIRTIFPIIEAGEVGAFIVDPVNIPLVFDHMYAYKFETLDGVKPGNGEDLRLSISTLIFWGAGDP